MAFRSHGSMLSTADFLFCPKNFGLANPPPCPFNQPPENEAEEKEFANFAAANAVEAIIEIRDSQTTATPTTTTTTAATSAMSTPTFAGFGARSSGPSHFQDADYSQSHPPPTLPSLWICRAVAMTEKDAQQSHGSISVSTDLMKQVKFVSDRARGRCTARVIPDYAEAKRLYGLHAVQLTFSDQFLSRSDAMMVIESMRDHVLYVGQEILYGGFHLRVQELLLSNKQQVDAPQTPAAASSTSSSLLLLPVQCGIVTSKTMVNISSHAFVNTVLIELSEEMWWPAIDGRITLNWVFERFLRQFTDQLPKYKSIPYVRVVLFGRLLDPSVSVKDVYHVVTLERTRASLERLADDASYHCQLFLSRLLKELHPTVKEAKRLFVSSKCCNFLEAVNLVLHTYASHNIDRRLDTTGQSITIVSAGKCLYRVANDLSQITSARMLDIGVKMCNVIVVGRPPLHSTPLFEFSFDDPSLRSQYHLQLEHDLDLKHVYVKPDWIRCFFFHAAPYVAGLTPKCELLEREQWEAIYPIVGNNASASSAQSHLHHGIDGCGQSVYYPGLSLPPVSRLPLVIMPVVHPSRSSPLSSTLDSRENTHGVFARAGSDNSSNRRSFGNMLQQRRSVDDMGLTSGNGSGFVYCLRVKTRWFIRDRDRRVAVGLNILDTDVTAGNLTLTLHVECCVGGTGASGGAAAIVVWNRTILQSDALFDILMSCFSVHFDDMMMNVSGGSFGISTSAAAVVAQKRTSFLLTSSSSPAGGQHHLQQQQHVGQNSTPSTPHFFNAKKMFKRANCVIIGEGDGSTMTLDAVPVETAGVCKCPEEVLFCIRKELLEVLLVNPPIHGDVSPAIAPTAGPAPLLDVLSLPGTAVIGYMQVQCAILFPVQPINPYLASSQVIPGIIRNSSSSSKRKDDAGGFRRGSLAGSISRASIPPPAPALAPVSSSPLLAARAGAAVGGGGESSAAEDSRFLTIDNLYKARWVYTQHHPSPPSLSTGQLSGPHVEGLPTPGGSSSSSCNTTTDASSASWQELCCCELLPLEGEKPRYSSESMEMVSAAYHVPPGMVKSLLKELVVQRALQQYQVCSGLCAAFSPILNSGPGQPPSTTPTTAPVSAIGTKIPSSSSSDIVVEMTIGHQHHLIAFEEDTNTIRITRQLHRGMYLLPQATNIVNYSYSLWNYLCDEIQVREMQIEAQTGGKNAYPWEQLDRWILMHPAVRSPMPPSSAGLKQRQIRFNILPEDCERPTTFEEFDAFISKRFSSRLRPRHSSQARSVWTEYTGDIEYCLDDEEDGGGVDYQERGKCGTAGMEAATGGGCDHRSVPNSPSSAATGSLGSPATSTVLLLATSSNASRLGTSVPSPAAAAESSQRRRQLETVVLEHVAQDDDFRTPTDPNTGKTLFCDRVQDRSMSMEVSLSPHYTPKCAFTLEVAWLVASSTLIADWASAFVINAPRSRLRAVRVPCLRDVELGNPLQAVHVVEPMPDYAVEGIFRERLLRSLIEKFAYFPDSIVVDRNCRLIHASGLSFVDSLRDRVVWCENYLVESSSAEQFAQYKQFREVERTVRQETLLLATAAAAGGGAQRLAT